MGIIAIAANPASGRDIRRFVSHATVFNNQEKQNIVERLILAAYKLGGHKFMFMPDNYGFANRIMTHLVYDMKELPEENIYIAQMHHNYTQADTKNFAAYASQNGADVLIVLGGDGTSRIAAKGIGDIPMISISTGTNNVYPEVIEGTVAGMAAAAIASNCVDTNVCCKPCKRIEIYKNGSLEDIALVDIVFSDYEYSGAKAIWNRDDISRVVVTQCHPASIGFSAIPGCKTIVRPEEDFAAVAECGNGAVNTKVSLAAGVISKLEILSVTKLSLGEELNFEMKKSGILALDGEREVQYAAGDRLTLKTLRNGPKRVDIRQTIELAMAGGLFDTQ